tara:strand:+ start:2271 stop:2534 length:264 start_codon:yes stop_codon:yes gene_type:complete
MIRIYSTTTCVPCIHLKRDITMVMPSMVNEAVDFVYIDKDANEKEYVLKHTKSVPFMVDSKRDVTANGYDDIMKHINSVASQSQEEE